MTIISLVLACVPSDTTGPKPDGSSDTADTAGGTDSAVDSTESGDSTGTTDTPPDTGCDTTVPVWADADGDGYGDPASVGTCADARFVPNDDDCDDADGAVHPGARELCDGLDQDCDGADIACGIAGERSVLDVPTSFAPAFRVELADVDGDGLDDVLGCSDDARPGQVSAWTGPFSGSYGDGDAWMSVEGEGDDRTFGWALVGSHDLDGDGVDDLAVGAAEADTTGFDRAGVVYVFAPTAGDWAASDITSTRIEGESRSAGAGTHLAAADADGDGNADLLLDASGVDTAWVLAGPLPGGTVSTSAADLTVLGTGVGKTSTLADVDGDGMAEVLLGAWGSSDVYVIAGGTRGVVATTDADATITGWDPAANPVDLAVGDLDADGYDDLVTTWNAIVDVDVFSQLDAYAGPLSGTLRADDAVGSYRDSLSDTMISLALGDVDADGREDLVVGASGWYWETVILLGPVVGAEDSGDAYGFVHSDGDSWSALDAVFGDTDGDLYADLLLAGSNTRGAGGTGDPEGVLLNGP